MDPALPLGQMSVNDKLTAIEQIWTSLSANASDVPAPPWHKDVLAAREQRVKHGESSFVPIDEMKERLRKATG